MIHVLCAVRLEAHNLNHRINYVAFDHETMEMIKARAKAGQQLLRANDIVGLVMKATPDVGTPTGAGGYSTFFIPVGGQVVGAHYGFLNKNGEFVITPMKGQSILALGDGSSGSKSSPQLVGLQLGPNITGQTSLVVDNSGAHRGTMAGLYSDTGIFYSTDPATVWMSWATGGGMDGNPATLDNLMVNNSGDVVTPTTRWDAEQLLAWGSKNPPALIDSQDQRGNAPWGMASAVAGPESGYAWHFNKSIWDGMSANPNRMKLSVSNMGPWKRIRYPGSMAAKDVPGRKGSDLGYVGVNAADIGHDLNTFNPLPPTTSWTDSTSPKAIRMAWGNLELFRPEYCRVRLKILKGPGESGSPFDSDGFLLSYADTFGGDAGGEYNNKDHLWRYYEPTRTDLAGKPFIAKHASKPIVASGENFHYDITVVNFGFNTLTNVIVEDLLPSGVSYVSAQPPLTSTSSPLTWKIPSMAPQTVKTFKLNVRATGSGIQVNTASTRSDQTPKTSTLEIIDIISQALLYPDKAVTPSTAQPGELVTYTLVIENTGTAASATPMVITEMLPDGFVYDSLVSARVNNAPVSNGSLSVNSANSARPVFNLSQAINADGKLEITFRARISQGQPAGTYTNSYIYAYSGKVMSTGALAPVTVGGARLGGKVFRDWNGDGQMIAGEEGMPGLSVQLWNAAGTTLIGSRTTDSSGGYVFAGVASPATYQVRVEGVPTGYTATYDLDGVSSASRASVPLAAGQERMDVDFGYQPGGAAGVGGRVFNDTAKDGKYQAGTDSGIASVTVRLHHDRNQDGKLDAGDLLLSTATSGAEGVYNFTGLAPGLSYLVQVDAEDADIPAALGGQPVRITTPGVLAVPALNSQVTGKDFGFWKEQPSSLGGRVYLDNNGNAVFDAGDTPVTGIPVRIFHDADGDGTARQSELVGVAPSDGGGRYRLDDLPGGDFIVRLGTESISMPPGYRALSEEHLLVLETGASRLDLDFMLAQLLSKMANRSSAVQGDQIVYTLIPNYQGDGALENLTIQDVLPAGTTFVSAGQGGALGSFVSQPGSPGQAGNPVVQVANGTYTGNGSDNRNITSAGFQPDLVIIKGASSVAPAFRTSTMSGDASKLATANSLASNIIQSLLSNGFQLGTNAAVNSNGMRYDWVAFRASAGVLSVGSYTGNGSSASRLINNPGFSPEAVFVMPANSSAVVMKTATMMQNESFLFTGGSAATNLITGFESTGFRVSTGSNASSTVYHYVAWKAMDGITSTGSFTGNGVDDRSITDPGFRPEFVLMRSASSSAAVMRPASLTSDLSLFGSATASAANNIQSLLDQGFQVGTDARVNASGSEIHWAAFRAAAATPLTTTALNVSKTLCKNSDLVTLTMTLTSNSTLSGEPGRMPESVLLLV
ncbi:MAG TPA: hypothetical protein DIT13_09940, partial [Verrucomicrobiales bacterium]|nr:hypothetical protein [Verrucomicrobiales bacterium]